jgi:hypothetical protein
VHSRYQRRLADAPAGGRRTMIVLSVRRLFCDHDGCDRRTFAEQVKGLTVRYGRRTPLLRSLLEQLAVALAGRAGARLARSLHAPTSRSTMLRLVMALPDPAAATPRVLGVDDFALRRGHVYGTVLVDCETSAPVELLAGRDARPLADWLAAHPGVEVICRDRSGAYGEGARAGAPDAVQVADRFHLWQNLGKAVEGCVARHRACLRGPGPDAEPIEPQEQARPQQVPGPAPEEVQPAGRFAERARRHHALVHDLVAQGHGLRAIARQLGWGRHTVQRHARATTWQELVDGRWQQQRPRSWMRSSRTCASAGSRAAPTPPNCTGSLCTCCVGCRGCETTKWRFRGMDTLPREVFEVVVAVTGLTISQPLQVGTVRLLPAPAGLRILDGLPTAAFDQPFREAPCHALVVCTAHRTVDAEQDALHQVRTALAWIAVRVRYGLLRLPDETVQPFTQQDARSLPKQQILSRSAACAAAAPGFASPMRHLVLPPLRWTPTPT